jgi:hypothetical protein
MVPFFLEKLRLELIDPPNLSDELARRFGGEVK